MPNLLLRDIPEASLAELKQAAGDHGRSLQAELLALVNDEADRLARTRAFQARVKPRKLRGKADVDALIRTDREKHAAKAL